MTVCKWPTIKKSSLAEREGQKKSTVSRLLNSIKIEKILIRQEIVKHQKTWLISLDYIISQFSLRQNDISNHMRAVLSITLILSALLADVTAFALESESAYFLVLQSTESGKEATTIPITSIWHTENGWRANSSFLSTGFEAKRYCLSLAQNCHENVTLRCFNYETFGPETKGILQIEENSAQNVESIAFLQTPGNPKNGKAASKGAPIKVLVKDVQKLPKVNFSVLEGKQKVDKKNMKVHGSNGKKSKNKNKNNKENHKGDDDDKNFIQKYWMYILAAVIVFIAPQ